MLRKRRLIKFSKNITFFLRALNKTLTQKLANTCGRKRVMWCIFAGQFMQNCVRNVKHFTKYIIRVLDIFKFKEVPLHKIHLNNNEQR